MTKKVGKYCGKAKKSPPAREREGLIMSIGVAGIQERRRPPGRRRSFFQSAVRVSRSLKISKHLPQTQLSVSGS